MDVNSSKSENLETSDVSRSSSSSTVSCHQSCSSEGSKVKSQIVQANSECKTLNNRRTVPTCARCRNHDKTVTIRGENLI